MLVVVGVVDLFVVVKRVCGAISGRVFTRFEEGDGLLVSDDDVDAEVVKEGLVILKVSSVGLKARVVFWVKSGGLGVSFLFVLGLFCSFLLSTIAG